MENRLNKMSILTFLILTFFAGIFLFVRSFMGIYLFNFRIGELGVLFCFLLSGFYVLFLYRKKLIEKKIGITYLLIIFSFFLVLIISGSSILDTYTYKASSYIWTMAFILVGVFVYNNIDFDEIFLKIFGSFLPLIYFLLVLIPENIKQLLIDFFGTYSDKYEMHKGSDLLIMYLIVFMINNRKLSKNNLYIYYFVIISSLYLPLFMFKSRSAFFAALIFILVEVLRNKKVIFNGNKRTISLVLLFFVVFNLSVFFITNSKTLDKDASVVDLISLAESRYQAYNQDVEMPMFFYRNNRLYSADGNLNWRLQIWQDVFYDMKRSNQTLLFGYGFKDKIPAMEKVERTGLDFKNENVHNNFINIYARGGLLQLSLFIGFYYFVVTRYKEKFGNFDILIYIIPILFCSFFDASMENSHFPLLYYFFLGRLLIKEY